MLFLLSSGGDNRECYCGYFQEEITGSVQEPGFVRRNLMEEAQGKTFKQYTFFLIDFNFFQVGK